MHAADERHFYLFGTPVTHSPSPILHNTGFQFHKLPYKYAIHDTPDISDVVAVLRRDTTGGGSVTIPHKQSIMPHLDELSAEARKVGAVNTVVKQQGRLLGHNTDWLAVARLIEARSSAEQRRRGAVVIGAGGTAHAACYALASLGVPFEVYNRTADKAQQLATLFGGGVRTSLAGAASAPPVGLWLSTVPPAAQTALPAGLVRGDQLLLELVYRPLVTPLLQEGLAQGATLVSGIDVLLEQGLAQFELFSSRPAPRAAIAQALMEQYNGGELTRSPLYASKPLS